MTNEAIKEPMVPGDYTALGFVTIRSQMKTSPSTNIVGGYTNGLPFRVYQVYPEVDGILWGRVSSNTGAGKARFAALRVNNNDKAVLELADEPTPPMEQPSGLVGIISSLIFAIRDLASAINSLATAYRSK